MAYLRSGFGDYGHVPSIEWMFYPPPYTFADPAKLTPPAGFHAPPEMMGLGCGSSCTCGGTCSKLGLGLFDTADWTQWGLAEWATIGLGLYVGMSILGDIGRGARGVKKTFRRRRRVTA